MAKPTREQIINTLTTAVAEEYDADLYLYSGEVNYEGYGAIVTALSRGKSRDRALLILATNGGSANAAYQIARTFHRVYEEFVLFTPGNCKSAGTLIALGAQRLILTDFSELGPLDVQLYKQNEIAARKSGLLTKSSFESLAEASFDLFEKFMLQIVMKGGGLVSFKVAAELSASMTSSLMSPVFSQMNPEIMGSDYRDLSVALQYGARLAEISQNAELASIYRLINAYPSHDFIIDSDEAKSLFKTIEEPSQRLYGLASFIGSRAFEEADELAVVVLAGIPPEGENENANPIEDEDTGLAPHGEDDRRGHQNSTGAESGIDADEIEPAHQTAPRAGDAGGETA